MLVYTFCTIYVIFLFILGINQLLIIITILEWQQYIYIHIHSYICMCFIHICVYTYMYVYTCMHICIYICVHAHTCMCIYVYTHIVWKCSYLFNQNKIKFMSTIVYNSLCPSNRHCFFPTKNSNIFLFPTSISRILEL